MYSMQDRIRELQRIIREAQEELHALNWAYQTQGAPSGWFKQEKTCTMPQGYPSHCGCNW